MFRNLMLALAVLAVMPAASAATSRTPAEEAACRRDALHFCRGAADDFQVRDCLVAQKQKLSRNCRGVLETHGL